MTIDLQVDVVKGNRLLDVAVSASWIAQLQAALASAAQEISIDMGGVEKIDTACLQALTAFVIALRECNKAVNWLAASNSFKAAVEDLGLSAVLDANNG